MRVKERFLNYTKYNTESDEKSGKHPSSDGQLVFAEELVKELKEIGIANAYLDEFGYVYAKVPATKDFEDVKPIGLIAHMDTAPYPAKDVEKRTNAVIKANYDGEDIVLNDSVTMRVSEHISLKEHIGHDLIVTDGKYLLGADDKAGIAEIISAMEIVVTGNLNHGEIFIAFTPDEEIGQGADEFSLEKFGADYAYTVDGGEIGELEYENFNAAGVKIIINGVDIHPGEAKGKMKNSMLMANEFINNMPEFETPSKTSGYAGFFHITEISGNVETTEISMIIRDHDRHIFQGRKEFIEKLITKLNKKYGENTFEIEIKDSYYNMRDMILPHMWIIDKAKAAMKECGVEPKIVPIRGGTDGARISYMGLPCPNLSTGGRNFHGKFEYISVQNMEKMTNVLVKLLSVN